MNLGMGFEWQRFGVRVFVFELGWWARRSG
jgi:hypothetical protein